MTTSFAMTIAASRGVNFRPRAAPPLPLVRSAGRLFAQVLVSNSVRMHHFLPRVALGFSTGGTPYCRTAAASRAG